MILNFSLVVPISILVLSLKEVDFPEWIAISNAAFTFYKVIIAIYAFFKTRKSKNLTTKALKNISFTEAFLSLLMLSNTLIMTFTQDNEDTSILFYINILLGMWIIVTNFIISLKAIILGINEGKKLKIENDKEVTL